MVSRTSARLSASQARIGSYASKIGFQIGSLSRRRSLANPIVGVCDVAIAPMIFAMIALLVGVKRLNGGSHHSYDRSRRITRADFRRSGRGPLISERRSAIIPLNRR